MHKYGIRLEKREDIPLVQMLAIGLAAVALALVVCGVFLLVITKTNPVSVFAGIIDGAIGTNRRLWVTIRDSLVLLLVAVALVPAFKMKFWNIGAEGQILMGGLVSAALMIYGKSLPNALLLPLIFVSSCVAGFVWGLIPAVFKAKFNTNETLFTLMMNYVAMQIISCCIVLWENPIGSNTVGIINSANNAGWFPFVFGLRYGLNLIIVVFVTVMMALYLKFTKHGYEISVVGESRSTALYAGINVNKVIVRTVGLSGSVCGLAGCLVVCGASHTVSTSLAGGRGFTAIIVAWMSLFNSFVMAGVSFFLCFMQNGAIQIASQFGLNDTVSDILVGILIFFFIGSGFFTRYKVHFVPHEDKGDL